MAWLGLVQLTAPAGIPVDIPRLLSLAGVLGSLTVLVYRLGVWRQGMEDTKSNVGAEVRSHREESASNFARIEQRLEALEHLMTDSMEFKQTALKWHKRSLRRLNRLERKVE
jgi:hypothetical protein